MARPRKKLPANGLEIISELAARGVKEVELAKALGMTFKTWQKLREENPAAKAAWDEAKAVERDALVGVLYEKAMGGDSPAAMFLLKARHGYRDHGATEGGDGPRVNLTFNIPSALKPEQYEKLIQVSPALPADEK